MRLSISKSKNAILFYIIKSTYIDKKHSTKIVEKLGTLEEVKIKANGEDPYIWAKRYAEELTKKEKDGLVKSLKNILKQQLFLKMNNYCLMVVIYSYKRFIMI